MMRGWRAPGAQHTIARVTDRGKVNLSNSRWAGRNWPLPTHCSPLFTWMKMIRVSLTASRSAPIWSRFTKMMGLFGIRICLTISRSIT